MVALVCDNSYTQYGISFEYRKRDIQTDLMAIYQILQQWSGERTRKYYAVRKIVPNICNKYYCSQKLLIMRQIAISDIKHLSFE